MIRRDVIRGAASLGVSIASSAFSPFAFAQTDACQVRGYENCKSKLGKELCLINGDVQNVIRHSVAPPPVMSVPWKERVALKSSSISGFDEALRLSVLQPLGRMFQVNPKFGYYGDLAYDGKRNALASTDGVVLFGTGLLEAMLKAPGGDYAVMAACAHEFAHLKQFETGIHMAIVKSLPCYCVELHADFMAGFFVRRFRSLFSGASIQSIGAAWAAWDKESCSHGSRQQRMDALEKGFGYGDPALNRTIDQAMDSGRHYLTRYL